MRDRIFIGVDPGVKTGMAVWDGKDIVSSTTDFWGAIEEIEYWQIPVTVVIENPNLNKPVFARSANKKSMQRIAQNVGMNKKEAQLLIDYCRLNDIKHRVVKPTTSKWDAKTLKTITGITKRTNQHERDAIKLVYGL